MAKRETDFLIAGNGIAGASVADHLRTATPRSCSSVRPNPTITRPAALLRFLPRAMGEGGRSLVWP